MNILLIDTRVSHSEAIVASIDPALSLGITFDYYTDTFDTLKERIVLAIREHSGDANATLANSVGLVQHNYIMSTFKFVDAQTTSSIIEQVETQDKELTTWAPLKEFISWCKTELSTAHFDMMACALYSNPDWKYAIDTLSVQTGVEIRASTDDTGSAALGGNWFLESHVGINLKEVYFTDKIEKYLWTLKGTPTLTPVTITKTYGTTFGPLYSGYAEDQYIIYGVPLHGVAGFPVLNSLTSWTLDVGFRLNAKNGTYAQYYSSYYRTLLGSMYNSTDVRGWGIWVGPNNVIYYSQSSVSFPTNLTALYYAPYNLNVAKVGTTVIFTLTNISSGEFSTYTRTNVIDAMGTGPVSIGGWSYFWTENTEFFLGEINYVEVKNYFSLGSKAFQVTAPIGSSTSNGAMTYSNPSDTSVASISQSGLITINKAGTVYFTELKRRQSTIIQPRVV